MWFRTLFDTLLARSSRTRSRKRRLAPSFRRRSRSSRPLLRILEDRTLLSTYVVLDGQSIPRHVAWMDNPSHNTRILAQTASK